MSHWRITVVLGLFCLLSAGALVRLGFLQIIQQGLYKALAQGQQQTSSLAKGERGQIFVQDKKGDFFPLASNKRISSVFISPSEIKDADGVIEILSDALSVSKEVLAEKISYTDSVYQIIEKNITKEQEQPIEKEKLSGVYIGQDVVRFYPQAGFASRILGFTNQDGKGQYGVEEQFNDILEGKEGINQDVQNPGGYLFLPSKTRVADGKDIVLTIDYNIQSFAESLLEKKAEDLNYEEGTIVVADPTSGKILAMAVYPNFDPNQYGKVKDLSLFQNPSVQNLFEPGSIFKPFTMAVALNEGKITPDATFIDTGSVKIGPAVIYNFDRKVYGVSDMSRVLEKSINTGAVWISQQIPHDTFVNYLGEFGFNQKTGVDVQGEVYSRNDILKTGSATGFATASFGQGIEMTPVQLAAAFSMFANGGKVVTPYVVEKMVSGGQEQKAQPNISGQVISAKTAEQVTKMMINVVERGFGDIARIPGYYLAGKTGTAQVSYEDKKGYYPDKTIQSFIGFGPALKPEFLILVKLDDPKVPTSSLSAAPIFGKLAQFIINYWQIPPDY